MRFHYVGHACVMMQEDGFSMITDPWFGEPLNYGTFHAFPPIKRLSDDEIGKIDILHISHSHQDHLCPTTLRYFSKSIQVVIAKHSNSKFRDTIATLGFSNILEIEPGTEGRKIGPFQIYTFLPQVFDGSFDSSLAVRGRSGIYYFNNDCILDDADYQAIRRGLGTFKGCFLGYTHFLPGPTCFRAGASRNEIHPGIQKIYDEQRVNAWAHVSMILKTLAPEWAAPYAAGIRFLNEDLKIHNRTFASARGIEQIERHGARPYLLQPGDRVRNELWENLAGGFLLSVPEDKFLPELFENRLTETDLYRRKEDYDRFFLRLIGGEARNWIEPMSVRIEISAQNSKAHFDFHFDGEKIVRVEKEPDIVISYPAPLVNDVIDGRMKFAALHHTYRFEAEVRRYIPSQMSVYRWGLD